MIDRLKVYCYSVLIGLAFVCPNLAFAGSSDTKDITEGLWSPNFNLTTLSDTIAQEIVKKYKSQTYINERIQIALGLREKWMDSKNIYGLNRISQRRLDFHSTPFFDLNYRHSIRVPTFLRDILTGDSSDRPALIDAIGAVTGDVLSEKLQTKDFVNYPDETIVLSQAYRVLFADELGNIKTEIPQRDDIPEWHTLSLISDPLVEWLAAQKKSSVTHLELFNKAVEIYKDPFMAIGVIGFIFDTERLSISSRQRQAILGSRMASIFPGKTYDTIGTNYHFWAYLNISLLNGGHNLMDNSFSYLWEIFHQNDYAEYSVNYWGLRAGEMVLERIETVLQK